MILVCRLPLETIFITPTVMMINRKDLPMEELQKALVAEIGKQLVAEPKNIQLLDVLNRLLGTVSTYLNSKG